MGSKTRTLARRAGFIGLGALAAWVVIWPDVFQGVRDYPARYLQAAQNKIPTGWDSYFAKYELPPESNALLPFISGQGEQLVRRLDADVSGLVDYSKGKPVDFRKVVLQLAPSYEFLPHPRTLKPGKGYAPNVSLPDYYNLTQFVVPLYMIKGLAELQAGHEVTASEWIDGAFTALSIFENTAGPDVGAIYGTECLILTACGRLVADQSKESTVGKDVRRFIASLQWVDQHPDLLFDADSAVMMDGDRHLPYGKSWLPGATIARRSKSLDLVLKALPTYRGQFGDYSGWARLINSHMPGGPFSEFARAMSYRKIAQEIVQVVDQDFTHPIPGEAQFLGYGLYPQTKVSEVDGRIIATFKGATYESDVKEQVAQTLTIGQAKAIRR